MSKFSTMVNHMCFALNKQYGKVILYETQQFFSETHGRAITMHILQERIKDEETGKVMRAQLIKSATPIDLVKYLSERLKEEKESLTKDEDYDIIPDEE